MSTVFQENADVVLTPKEAEAVFELWAKRQAEGEAARANMTVRDMSEAMSIPADDVQILLNQVRSSQNAATPPALKTVRPVNKRLIALVAVAWLVIVTGVFFLAYSYGYTEGQHRGVYETVTYPPASAPPASGVVDTAAPTAVRASEGDAVQMLPSGVSAVMKGYEITGEATDLNLSEDLVKAGLNKVVDKVAGTPKASADVLYEDTTILKALDTNDPKLVNGQIKFEKMIVRKGTFVAEQQIPIAMTGAENIVQLVKQERDNRIAILANQALRFGKENLTPPAAP